MFAPRAGKMCNRRYMAGNFVTGAKSVKACQQQGRENIRALGAGRCVTGDRSAKMRLRERPSQWHEELKTKSQCKFLLCFLFVA